MSQSIDGYLKASSLVSVHREGIDSQSLQGFLLGASESLLALEYVHDFQVDGLMILRRADITDVQQSETDEFQERLLKGEGIVAGALSLAPLQLHDWKSVIDQLASDSALIIVEQELEPEPEFAIGRPIRTTNSNVEFQSFSGTGDWYDEADKLEFSQITCLQAFSRYLSFYQRYFEREAG